MALMPCPDCGAQMSVTAKACPNCGYSPSAAPAQRGDHWKALAITCGVGVLLAAWMVSKIAGSEERPRGEIPKGPGMTAEERQKELDFQLVLVGAKALKARAKNPDTFRLKKALLMPSGVVCYEYRGTNSFNAVVPGYVAWTEKGATSDDASWNKHCAGKPGGKDFSYARSAL